MIDRTNIVATEKGLILTASIIIATNYHVHAVKVVLEIRRIHVGQLTRNRTATGLNGVRMTKTTIVHSTHVPQVAHISPVASVMAAIGILTTTDGTAPLSAKVDPTADIIVKQVELSNHAMPATDHRPLLYVDATVRIQQTGTFPNVCALIPAKSAVRMLTTPTTHRRRVNLFTFTLVAVKRDDGLGITATQVSAIGTKQSLLVATLLRVFEVHQGRLTVGLNADTAVFALINAPSLMCTVTTLRIFPVRVNRSVVIMPLLG